MKNIFTIVRGALLGSVAAWTLIVLGIAIHFQMSFVNSASQLTYVSLAVFVAATTLAVFLLLLVAPLNKKVANVLKTKWELVWLGILGILWLSLAGYTTAPSVSQAEVECWDEDEDGEVVETDVEGYSNDVYHARYRVLQAFAFFNAVLLFLLFLFILALAFWHHKRGRYVIWTTPTTAVGWFDRPGGTPAYRKSYKDERYEQFDDEKQGGSKKKYPKFDMLIDEKPKYKTESPRYKAEDKEPLVQKPPAVARSDSATMKPKQYVVYVPSGETVKPALAPVAPIAAKMTESNRQKAENYTRPQPDRQTSQRELADQMRQQARRDRADYDDTVIRPAAARQNSTKAAATPAVARTGHKRTESSSDEARPSGARITDVRRQQQQQSQPGVVRSGSGAGAGVTRNPSQTRAEPPTNSNNPFSDPRPTAARKQTTTTTQPRAPGRRI